MIEDEKLGLKIAENPKEKLIMEMISNAENRILQLELTIEIEKNVLEFLKSKTN